MRGLKYTVFPQKPQNKKEKETSKVLDYAGGQSPEVLELPSGADTNGLHGNTDFQCVCKLSAVIIITVCT